MVLNCFAFKMNIDTERRHLELAGLGSLISQMNMLVLKNPEEIRTRKGEAIQRYDLIVEEINRRYSPDYVPDPLIH